MVAQILYAAGSDIANIIMNNTNCIIYGSSPPARNVCVDHRRPAQPTISPMPASTTVGNNHHNL